MVALIFSLSPYDHFIEPWGDEMKIKVLRSMLYVVVISTPVLAQKAVQPDELVGAAKSGQTLFAYTTFGARLDDALTGDSILPSDVPVALTTIDPSALATAKLNSTLTFRVAYGLSSYAHTGTLIEAKVIRLRDGNLQTRSGRIEPRVMEVIVCGLVESCPSPGFLKLRLEGSPRSRSSRTAKRLLALPLTVPLKAAHIALLVPEAILLGIACSTSSCDL
jgi:hypothetical protein